MEGTRRLLVRFYALIKHSYALKLDIRELLRALLGLRYRVVWPLYRTRALSSQENALWVQQGGRAAGAHAARLFSTGSLKFGLNVS